MIELVLGHEPTGFRRTIAGPFGRFGRPTRVRLGEVGHAGVH